MRRRWLGWAFGVALAAHLIALYWPRIDPPAGLPSDSDKAAHLLLFGVPVLLATLWLRRPRWAVLGFLLHAPLSEGLQAAVLPGRSGDPLDAAWDVVGIALGLGLGLLVRRRDPDRSSPGRW